MEDLLPERRSFGSFILTAKVTPLFLFGLGPLELALIVAIVVLLFGAPIVMRLGRRLGEVVGATERSREEFEAGREAE